MKTYNSNQIDTTHNRIRLDQNRKLYQNKQQIEKFIQKQKKTFNKQNKKWQQSMRQYLYRLNQRRHQTLSTSPQIFNQYQYYTKVNWFEGRQYSQIWRKNQFGKQQLVLDIMSYYVIKQNFNTVQLKKTSFSPNNRYIAFGFDLHNNQQIAFMIKDMKTKNIVGIKGWQNNRLKSVDNVVFHGQQGIFYTKVINRRTSQVWYQNIHNGQSYKILNQQNGQYYLDIYMAKDQKKLIITSNSRQDSKIWIIDTKKIDSKFQLIQFKYKNNQNKKLVLNHNGQNYVLWCQNQIILINQNKLEQKTIIYKLKQQNYQTITDIDIFKGRIVLYMKKMLKPMIKVLQIQDKNVKQYEVPLSYQIGTVSPGANQMLKTQKFTYYLNNLFIYDQGYQFNFNTKVSIIKQKFSMTGPKFNIKDYLVQIHEVPGQDGQLVPLTTIIPKRYKNKRNKMILHVYGHYGLNLQINFNQTYWSALQNGWSLAYAHVRGGKQKGQNWYKSGIKDNKYKNWFDLQDCTAYLIKNNFTHPNILILQSSSAGGITIWNAINRNPHLYKAVVMAYPFLDVLGSLLDKNKPLSQTDYAQFTDPNQNLQNYNLIQSISPYQNIIQNNNYPLIYIIAGTNDYRCPIQQIASFTKRYRQLKNNINQDQKRYQNIGQNGLLIKINQGSHEGLANISQSQQDSCHTLALLDYIVQKASYDVRIQQ